jgi:hypothetical protein
MVARGDERRPVPIVAHVLGAAALLMVLLAPFGAAAKYEAMGVTRFVKSVWEPRPAEEHAQTPPARPGIPPARAAETPDALRARARRMAETGDTNGAFDAFRRAALVTR